MGRAGTPGEAALHLVDGVALLRPDEQVFGAMLDGWRAQQLARNLAFISIEKRLNAVRAFATHADALPWLWRSQMLDDWLGICGRCGGCAVRRSATTPRRSRRSVPTSPIRLISGVGEGERRFGSHPVQVLHEWNTAVQRSAGGG